MTDTRKATLSNKELFAHNASSRTTGDYHSLNANFLQIPDLIYHQSNKWRHDDGATSFLTTNQTTLAAEEERKYMKVDTFSKASMDANFPQIPDLIYHQSNKWRHDGGATSYLTTNQTTLVAEEERKHICI